MSEELPLLHWAEPAAPLFVRRDGSVSRAEFAAMAQALAAQLPPQPYLLNLCEDRCNFALVLAAAALRGSVALLPSTATPPALQALRRGYGEVPALSDDAASSALPLPQSAALPAQSTPSIPAAREVAVVFTSGSTGEPQPQRKSWRALLLHSGVALSRRLLDAYGACGMVATVPPQHMYGLETSIMMALAGGHSVWSGRPVFPQDVHEALAAMAAPRVLVTTPVHIRALLAAGIRLPQLACVISATAPLPTPLAEAAELAFGAPIMEIYGCSEAGSIASRRTVDGDVWQPIEGMRIEQRGSGSWVLGQHLDEAVLLQDELEPAAGHGDGFRLGGRTSDMLKVAGKRASLADLTQKLLSIPGVVDGVVFEPAAAVLAQGAAASLVRRPAALVVAPTLNEIEILTALGRLVDPVFLPRPLRKIDTLPRNAVGKLPKAALQRLLADA